MNINKELNELEDFLYDADMDDWYKAVVRIKQVNVQLENKLEKAIEALEFYADKDNWNFKSKGMMSGYSYYYIEFCEKDNKAQETLVDIDKIG